VLEPVGSTKEKWHAAVVHDDVSEVVSRVRRVLPQIKVRSRLCFTI
jgi:hypothetical protein